MTDVSKAGLQLGKTFGGNLTQQAARKMEQEHILKYWGPDLLNKINSIAPENWPTFGNKP